MNFELPTATAAKMTDFDILSDKDREPDTNPGVAIALTMLLANENLTMFDGFLLGALYTKTGAGQDSLVTDAPNLTAIGKAIGEFSWNEELAGYRMVFDHGLAGSSNLELTDCKLTGFRLFPKEGGSVQIKLKVESPDVPEGVRGKLSGFKSQEVHVLFFAPVVEEKKPDLADQGGEPKTPRGRRGNTQTPAQALAAQLGVSAD